MIVNAWLNNINSSYLSMKKEKRNPIYSSRLLKWIYIQCMNIYVSKKTLFYCILCSMVFVEFEKLISLWNRLQIVMKMKLEII